MRAVVQRVTQAAVTVDAQTTGAIGRGLLVLRSSDKQDAGSPLVARLLRALPGVLGAF